MFNELESRNKRLDSISWDHVRYLDGLGQHLYLAVQSRAGDLDGKSFATETEPLLAGHARNPPV
jgi:hypothetical protein